jgi:hypothetical protein
LALALAIIVYKVAAVRAPLSLPAKIQFFLPMA